MYKSVLKSVKDSRSDERLRGTPELVLSTSWPTPTERIISPFFLDRRSLRTHLWIAITCLILWIKLRGLIESSSFDLPSLRRLRCFKRVVRLIALFFGTAWCTDFPQWFSINSRTKEEWEPGDAEWAIICNEADRLRRGQTTTVMLWKCALSDSPRTEVRQILHEECRIPRRHWNPRLHREQHIFRTRSRVFRVSQQTRPPDERSDDKSDPSSRNISSG